MVIRITVIILKINVVISVVLMEPAITNSIQTLIYYVNV